MTLLDDAWLTAAAKRTGLSASLQMASSSARQKLIGEASDLIDSVQRAAELSDRPQPSVGNQRRISESSGTEPDGDDPLAVWAWRCDVQRRTSGPLSGRTVALKENIAMRGAPFSLGWGGLDELKAEQDATVVECVLEAGGRIVGLANTEAFCLSGIGGTAHGRAVRNPVAPDRMAGGSSSGCAAAVASGAADLAIGSDQGGSIRGPSSWCGIYGLKPSHGAVPYRGAFSLEPTLDHLGPMARSLEDLALLTDVLVSPAGSHRPACMEALRSPGPAPRIAFLKEGFDWQGRSDERVDSAVRAAVYRAVGANNEVSVASVPEHRDALGSWRVIMATGLATTFLNDFCLTGVRESLPIDLRVGIADRLREQRGAHAIPWTLVEPVLVGCMLNEHPSRLTPTIAGDVLGTARQKRWKLTEAYDEALRSADVLALPTRVFLPPLVSEVLSGAASYPSYATGLNTCGTNLTGHPALSVPCGTVDGLPVGLLLVARHGREDSLFRAARLVEGYSGNCT